MNDSSLHTLLLSEGLVTRVQLSEAISLQRSATSPIRLLRVLIERGYVAEKQLAETLSRWLSIPWVRIEHNEVTAGLLSLVPREVARRFTLFPLYLRRILGKPATLFVAMDDPTWEEALLTVAITAGMPVCPLVATRTQILAALARHYDAQDKERPTCPSLPAAANDDLILVEYPLERSRRLAAL